MLVLLSLFVQSLSIISRFYYVASQVLSVLIKNSTAELCDHWCLSVCRSVIRITHKHFYGCWNIATGDAVEVIRFWCWSRSGSTISFTLSLTLGDRTFYTICCHSWLRLQLRLFSSSLSTWPASVIFQCLTILDKACFPALLISSSLVFFGNMIMPWKY